MLNIYVRMPVFVVSLQYLNKDTVPPSRWFIVHQPIPFTEQTAGGSPLCCSGLFQ